MVHVIITMVSYHMSILYHGKNVVHIAGGDLKRHVEGLETSSFLNFWLCN